ncbi:MAG TPA: TIGR01777 family oxidoreductase [Solirubrobacteraceae bacterium]|nr:TIGR01777 family oxidoreductase [Solirubrobacteraceae bacterium]
MRITLTGATGLVGQRLVARLRDRGDEVTVLSRDPDRASASLGVPAQGWDPLAGRAPVGALNGRDAVVHLAGENVAQRWTEASKQAIRDSRVFGTRHLVESLRDADPRPGVLISGSATGYYGPRSDERLDESAPAGEGFLSQVCVAWEAAAAAATQFGTRTVLLRTGVVLDRSAGALAKMLPPFRAGLGGPVAGGRQFVPWIHLDDVVGLVVNALEDSRWQGPVNATAPEPATNAEFSKALGRALHRPAVVPVPGRALRLLFGEMAEVITAGQRAVPARAVALGHRFEYPQLDQALVAALG